MLDLPTIDDLSKKARGYYNAFLTGADSYISPNFLFVTSKVISLSIHPCYYILNYLSKQFFATTADLDNLIVIGNEVGVSRLPASKGRGYATFISTAGQSVATNAILTRSDGTQYKVLTGFITTGNNNILIESIAYGSKVNAVGGTKLSLQVNNPLITSIIVSSSGIAGGAEIEGVESFRERVLSRKRTLPITGTQGYYEYILRQEVSGITRVFFDRTIGTFSIYFMMDNTYSNGLPLMQDINNAQEVADSIAIMGTNPILKAPQLQPINVNLNIRQALSQETIDEIKLEISETIIEEGTLSLASKPAVFPKESLDSAVVRALGGYNFTVISPSSDIAIASGKIPSVGTINLSVTP
jgi:uncharacterized phage protein gp47/JayE